MKVVEPPTDEVMDYRGLSGYVKLAEGTLRKMVMRGEIPFFKIRSSVRFSKKRIDAWLEEHKREPAQTGKKAEGGAE
jgi:excisionase family DNA binding protein